MPRSNRMMATLGDGLIGGVSINWHGDGYEHERTSSMSTGTSRTVSQGMTMLTSTGESWDAQET